MNDQGFIDTHQHLILRDQLSYSWVDEIPGLAGQNFGPERYLDDVGEAFVGTLFLESGVDDVDYKAETRLISKMVGQNKMLGQIASCRPEQEAGFDDWLEECCELGVRGFRRILHVMPNEVSKTEVFRKNLRKIGRKGMSFDICMTTDQLPLAYDLAWACSDQKLILDHLGNPDISGRSFLDWQGQIARLASLPNLFIKFSGIASQIKAVSQAEVRNCFEHVVSAFGPERIIWGSDWPLVNLGSNTAGWIETSNTLLGLCSQEERARIARSNAASFYGLTEI